MKILRSIRNNYELLQQYFVLFVMYNRDLCLLFLHPKHVIVKSLVGKEITLINMKTDIALRYQLSY